MVKADTDRPPQSGPPPAHQKRDQPTLDEIDAMLGKHADGPPVVTSYVSDMLAEDEADYLASIETDHAPSDATDKSVVQRQARTVDWGFARNLAIVLAIVIFSVVREVKSMPDYRDVVAQISTAFDAFVHVGFSPTQPGEGLSPQDIKPSRDLRGGVEYLIVEGNVVNITDHAVQVPPLRVSLSSADGRTLASIITKVSKTELTPAETIGFKVEFENPPSASRSMSVEFIDSSDMAMPGR